MRGAPPDHPRSGTRGRFSRSRRWLGASARGIDWRLAGCSVLGLCAASPPVWFPGAGFLVVAGWAAFYAVVSGEDRRCVKRTAYLIGLSHMLYFSFSVRHVLLPAYLAIGFAGGLYYVLTAVWTRCLARYVPGPVAFGCGLAGALWLRAHFVEIQYPHVQPAHSLYHWPVLLGGLRWGSEELVNLLLGILAAALVDTYRAWRVGRPGFGPSLGILTGVAVVYGVSLLPLDPAPAGGTRTVRLLLIEPRRPLRMTREEYPAHVRERVTGPTLAAAGAGAADPPDLVVWPESVAVQMLDARGPTPGLIWDPDLGPPLPPLARRTRLVQGSLLLAADGHHKAIALLTDHRHRYQGHHEKQKIVPGGEHPPFLDYLPRAVSDWVRSVFERGMSVELPDLSAGDPMPPLRTDGGVPFGVLICYDNAFPGPILHLARSGAAFALVISNESWYRGGAELHQMHAMTVCRALEARLPVVRCTVDGATLVIGADGRRLAGLPFPVGSYDRHGELPVTLQVPAEPLRASPWLRGPLTWLVLSSLLTVIAPLLRSWGRLVRARFRGESGP